MKINRRKTETLVRWYGTLNCRGWPKELGEPEPRDYDGPKSRRLEWMDEIQMELGRRVLKQHNWGMEKTNETD